MTNEEADAKIQAAVIRHNAARKAQAEDDHARAAIAREAARLRAAADELERPAREAKEREDARREAKRQSIIKESHDRQWGPVVGRTVAAICVETNVSCTLTFTDGSALSVTADRYEDGLDVVSRLKAEDRNE